MYNMHWFFRKNYLFNLVPRYVCKYFRNIIRHRLGALPLIQLLDGHYLCTLYKKTAVDTVLVWQVFKRSNIALACKVEFQYNRA